jgi:hypothetical protein
VDCVREETERGGSTRLARKEPGHIGLQSDRNASLWPMGSKCLKVVVQYIIVGSWFWGRLWPRLWMCCRELQNKTGEEDQQTAKDVKNAR